MHKRQDKGVYRLGRGVDLVLFPQGSGSVDTVVTRNTVLHLSYLLPPTHNDRRLVFYPRDPVTEVLYPSDTVTGVLSFTSGTQ